MIAQQTPHSNSNDAGRALVAATLLVCLATAGPATATNVAADRVPQDGPPASVREVASFDDARDDRETTHLVEPIDLAGHWSGRWSSCNTGHKGPLFADFCRLSTGDYRVQFRGRFFGILPFRYSVVLRVEAVEPGVVHLRGQSYLGRLFGTFTYEATATACEFRADYRSCDDRGIFWLKKCCH
jgi:hypothetical protein